MMKSLAEVLQGGTALAKLSPSTERVRQYIEKNPLTMKLARDQKAGAGLA